LSDAWPRSDAQVEWHEDQGAGVGQSVAKGYTEPCLSSVCYRQEVAGIGYIIDREGSRSKRPVRRADMPNCDKLAVNRQLGTGSQNAEFTLK